ncbi:MAG: amino acid ABC transporter permease [Leptolyngbyaceae cyanobacterium SM1_1_3]|nr:amino acid ABC transporter permease [Leptolyngbyaceae cyanobacterium SM1_1_3]NJN02698.1 amino acid ABC transporter permease [Leptolyngbyaceae cyanobacterium RM1_1_2]NJO11968.1 amino acid ABC transporter permease [Leptolyngbyaceae cyanobacterium SL_1_1]
MTSITPNTSPPSPPLANQPGPIAWMRKNLFSDWFNSLLTVVVVLVLGYTVVGLLTWGFTVAQWQVIPNNLGLFMSGLYPRDLYWRVWTLLGFVCALGGLSWGVLGRNVSTLFSRSVLIGIGVLCAFIVLFPLTRPASLKLLPLLALVVGMAWVGRAIAKKLPNLGVWLSAIWLISLFPLYPLIFNPIPYISLVPGSILGGVGYLFFGAGRPASPVNDWGGLLLTLLVAVSGILLCFPLGLLLALGRRSQLPAVKWLSTAYIELVRGVPLIAILFMGQVMIPLFLPDGMRPERIARAVIGLTLFSAAYLAENVRAGLQAIPRGQSEAAASLGVNMPLTMFFIVLPQALKIAIPAIVGQFISLFQDTTLLSIVGLAELLGISRSILANPTYLGRYAEVYLFIGAIYWFFCYAMSLASRKIEQKLNTTH